MSAGLFVAGLVIAILLAAAAAGAWALWSAAREGWTWPDQTHKGAAVEDRER